jgi:environmental stress-induced protein Ves
MKHSLWQGSRLIDQADYRIMNWKNGKGKTAEIAIMPPGADLTSFVWRLSSARMDTECEFSRFPGYQRILTLIDGEGIELQRRNPPQETILLKKGEIFEFSGDEEVLGGLPFGSIEDLNLIFNPAQVQASFHRISLSRKSRSFQLDGVLALLFGVSGATVKLEFFPGEQKLNLSNRCTVVSDCSMVLVEPSQGPSDLILIELKYRAA